MANVTVGTIVATGDKTYSPATGVTIAAGDLVSLIDGKLQKTIATTRANAKACIGIAVTAFTPSSNLTGTAGEAINAGTQVSLRKVGSLWKVYKKKANEKAVGTAYNTKKAGQTITYYTPVLPVNVATITGKSMDLGVSLTHRTMYCASATSGKICPVADLASGMYFTLVGWGDADGHLVLNVVPFDNAS